MNKTNKYNGKKYKKKRVYSPIKDPYIVSNELASKENVSGIEIFMKLFNLEDAVWMLFFKDILKGHYSTPIPNMFRLENLIYLTSDEGLQKQIYSELMDIPDYNPLYDKIPIEKLSLHLQKYINNKQIEIEEQCKLIEENTFYLKNENCDFAIKGAMAFNPKYQKINFKNGYGILIYPTRNGLAIFSNFNLFKNNTKYKILLNNFYNTVSYGNKDTQLLDNGCVFIPLEIDTITPEKIENIIDVLQKNLIVKK